MNTNNFYSDSQFDAYDPAAHNPYFEAQAPVFVRQPVSSVRWTACDWSSCWEEPRVFGPFQETRS
jgi:hypothetical protein